MPKVTRIPRKHWRDAKHRIIEYSTPEPNTGCWLWLRSITRTGYGKIKFNLRDERAHRLSFKAFKGEIPDGMLVCHTCDQPSCVNPDHLFLGTNQDNTTDMIKKGRYNNGKILKLQHKI